MKILHFLTPNSAKPTLLNPKQRSFSTITRTQIVLHRNKQPISCSSSSNNGGDENISQTKPVVAPQPLDGVEIRFKRGSRKKIREGGGQDMKKSEAKSVQKPWEEMTLMEKAMEVYVGEKGLLFWLNKFAYASIYIVIGGWILFRFVGPSLNLYQLDTPPLDPKNILKG